MTAEKLEWVEIVEPRTKERMYANLHTGECVWDPPSDVPIKHSTDSQWWELFDSKTSRYYYYNASTQKTVWHRPKDADIVPLAKLQTIKQQSSDKSENKTKNRRSVGVRSSAVRGSQRNDSTGSSDSERSNQRDQPKRRHRVSGGKSRRPANQQAGSPNGTSFSVSNPSYENVVLRHTKSCHVARPEDTRRWSPSHSDEQGSLDSTETKPKQAKLTDKEKFSRSHNATMPNLRQNDVTSSPSSHRRSRSQDLVADLPVAAIETPKGSDSERNSVAKSQSFPQHSAPSRKVFRQSNRRTTEVVDMELFAKSNLNVHKKGLLRKKITIHTMLSWTREPIRKPMIMTKEKQPKKEACETFKLIQAYMGDRKVKKSDLLAHDVITRGWQCPGLRDEIFIQLCRQTTANPKHESMEKGLELLAMSLSFFPPSTKFYNYLEGYICTHLDFPDVKGVKVSQYAEVSYKRLIKIIETGAKRGNKKPSADEVNQSRHSIFNPSMFGNTLQEVMELQDQKFPDRRLPWILTTLSEEVLRLGGNQTEGIFRFSSHWVPGDIDEVNILKVQVDKWEIPATLRDPHVPGSLLKLWYRELEEPLIPSPFYDRCIEHFNSPNEAIGVVYQLPEINRLCLSYLIRFLQIFSRPENSKLTKMDANNLAMVMAPNCLRCLSNDPRVIFENTRKEMSYIRTLVHYYDTSFMDGIV